MLIKLPTEKSVSDASAALLAAVQAHHFYLLEVLNLREDMAKKGMKFTRDCLIYEVCQPQPEMPAYDETMTVSTALSSRISIYEEGGHTVLAALNPTNLLAMFNAPSLDGMAHEVEITIVRILEEAAAS